MSTLKEKNEVEVKPGKRINIDGQWFAVKRLIDPSTDTWELVGYSIPRGILDEIKKLTIRKTSEEICRLDADYIAEQVFHEGFQLPRPSKPGEKSLPPNKRAFIENILAHRQNRNPASASLSA